MKSTKFILLLAGITWSIQMIGQSQHALSFDGVNDYVNCGTDASLNITGPVTVELWLYFTDPQLQYKRFVVRQWETSYNLGVGAFTNSVLFGMAPNGNLNNTVQTGGVGVLTTGAWNHVAGTWDGDTLRIFVNGEPVAKKAWVNNSVAGSGFPTILGSDQVFGSTRFYDGVMDEVRIWNVARTKQEIRDNMYRELETPELELNLMAYYRFNEGMGQTSVDLSQKNNTATLGTTTDPESSDPAWVVSYAPIPYYTIADGLWNVNTTWAPTQSKPSKPWARASIYNNVDIPLNVEMNEIQVKSFVDLSINQGYNLAVHQLFSIESNSSFTMNQNCTLSMGANSAISVDGLFESFGAIGNGALITGAGYYTFDLNDGATIGAVYTTFEYMDLSGLNIAGEIDLAYALDYCTFQNGEAGGSLITFSGTEPATLTNVDFPTNIWSGSYNVSKTTNQGEIEFVDATGGFAGASYEFDPYDLIDWGEFVLEIKLFLEGAYTGTEMETGLNPVLPLNQPFNIAPWNYAGTETVPSIPGADIVDWILVELRDAPDAISATPLTVIGSQAAFINNLGEIIGLDGINAVRFGNTVNDNLFVVIRHRNHLSVMSAFALTNVSGTYSYDFTLAGTQVYGDGSGYKEISAGVWGMVSGDANADGIIDEDDKVLSWNTEAGTAGYLQSDVNLDVQSNNLDKNDFWLPNLGKYSQVPD